MGQLVSLAKPTAPMKMEAASAGVLDTVFGNSARLQILTIEDKFAGKKPATPPEGAADIGARYVWRPLGEGKGGSPQQPETHRFCGGPPVPSTYFEHIL